MQFVLSRYNHPDDWRQDYPGDYIIYDRSDVPLKGSIVVPNIGSDIYDKFTYIVENYDNLPDVAIYSKFNIFKYITKEEFNDIKDNNTFTPILTMNHEEKPDFSYYKDGIYWERNNLWYLNSHPPLHDPWELMKLLGIRDMEFVPFAPGSNYILTKEDIHKHSREFYDNLRLYLDWTVYPGEAMIIERSLFTLWS